jgi:ubiquinone/menaquinone biosynthesis C-methylase UbiE
MNFKSDKRVCPVELAGSLDNSLRKLFHNPKKILSSYINEGITVLDLGCGPGFFSVEIAKIVGESGKVIAADLQQGMLNKVKKKINGTDLEKRIELHKCEETKIGITQKIDFILCFWMVHEVPDKDNLFTELKSILKSDGKIFVIEPKFHVSKSEFEEMNKKVIALGFEVAENPKVFLSRGVLLRISN